MEIEKDRKTNMAVTLLIQRLYGQKDYSLVKNYKDIPDAKKYYTKILKSLIISISETITVSDKRQINELIELLEYGIKQIKACKSFDDIDQRMIATLAQLSFQLIGNCPDRWSRKNVINRKEYWELNAHRQIQYVQTPEHKSNAIKSIVSRKYSDRFGGWIKFLNFCQYDLKNEPGNLIKYMKENHHDIYEEVE
ncbi:MAG TPA: hypothetical protein PLK90_08730 [Clostridiales bacterium]|nr:hypothetical protein [Clostridiales bacterium]HQP70468.1 hypothetical protein [Clostridiales bacterium]